MRCDGNGGGNWGQCPGYLAKGVQDKSGDACLGGRNNGNQGKERQRIQNSLCTLVLFGIVLNL